MGGPCRVLLKASLCDQIGHDVKRLFTLAVSQADESLADILDKRVVAG